MNFTVYTEIFIIKIPLIKISLIDHYIADYTIFICFKIYKIESHNIMFARQKSVLIFSRNFFSSLGHISHSRSASPIRSRWMLVPSTLSLWPLRHKMYITPTPSATSNASFPNRGGKTRGKKFWVLLPGRKDIRRKKKSKGERVVFVAVIRRDHNRSYLRERSIRLSTVYVARKCDETFSSHCFHERFQRPSWNRRVVSGSFLL